jgi:hypothetical protein
MVEAVCPDNGGALPRALRLPALLATAHVMAQIRIRSLALSTQPANGDRALVVVAIETKARVGSIEAR